MEDRSSQAIRERILNARNAQKIITQDPFAFVCLKRRSITSAAGLYFDCCENVSVSDRIIINSMRNIVRSNEDYPQIREYNQLDAIINKERQELKMARDREFLEDVKTCDHIFYTGLCDGNHTKTTCLKCGINSDVENFISLSDYYFQQLEPIIINLFFNGDKLKYPSISEFFSSLVEAEDYYFRVKQEDVLLPSNVEVQKMLQLKGVNYIIN